MPLLDADKQAEFNAKLHEALGRASMAWSETPTGVFDSSACVEAGRPISKMYAELLMRCAELEALVDLHRKAIVSGVTHG